jgi:hypothetical protein
VHFRFRFRLLFSMFLFFSHKNCQHRMGDKENVVQVVYVIKEEYKQNNTKRGLNTCEKPAGSKNKDGLEGEMIAKSMVS